MHNRLNTLAIVLIMLVALAAILAISVASPMIQFVWRMLTSYFQALLIFGTVCLLAGAGLFFSFTRNRVPRRRKLTIRELEHRLK